MRLSIVIPVYNERETLFEIIARVLAVPLEIDRELILVDDYSRDGTRDLYAELPHRFPGADLRVVLHEVNRGKGAAVRTGFAHVRGDLVLIQDADLEYDPDDYPRLLAPLLAGTADVVYGSRFLGRQDHGGVYRRAWLANKALTLASNLFTGLRLTDMETCYKCFRAKILRSLTIRSDRFGIEPEITAKFARGGWRIREVPINYYGRSYEQGKKITWRDGVRALYCIVRYAFAD